LSEPRPAGAKPWRRAYSIRACCGWAVAVVAKRARWRRPPWWRPRLHDDPGVAKSLCR
jgi:hypothetical protein